MLFNLTLVPSNKIPNLATNSYKDLIYTYNSN